MRTFILSILLICSYSNTGLLGQLTLELGPDTTHCIESGYLTIGTEMKIENASGNITYSWECYYDYGIGLIHTASDFLDDSTKQFPTTRGWIPNKWFNYTLTISDESDQSATDNIRIRISEFEYRSLVLGANIIQGDSSLLYLVNIRGGIKPLDYSWEPRKWITDPESLVTWCKPDSSIEYSLRAIDSIGCVSYSNATHRITVIPNNIDQSISDSPIRLNSSQLVFSGNEHIDKSISIFDVNGRVIANFRSSENLIDLNQLTDQRGLLFITIEMDGKKSYFKYLKPK